MSEEPNYPKGKLNEDDEGELHITLSKMGETIVVDFGKSIKWIGMTQVEAEALAHALLNAWKPADLL